MARPPPAGADPADQGRPGSAAGAGGAAASGSTAGSAAAGSRGRADGEVISLFRTGLKDAPRASHIEEIRGEFVAIDRALERLNSGDLCLILVDQVEEALAHIAQRVAAAQPAKAH